MKIKVYLSGKITGDPDYRKKFAIATEKLQKAGYTVLNPAILPEGFEYEDYMAMCFPMVDSCQMIALLEDYKDSPGTLREIEHGKKSGIVAKPIKALLEQRICANCILKMTAVIEAHPIKIEKIHCFDGTEKNPADTCPTHGFEGEDD